MHLGLSEMLSALEEEGKIEIEEILARSKKQAERIKKEAKDDGKLLEEKEIDKATVTLNNEKTKMLNSVKLAVKKDTIRAKEEMILSVLEEARERLKETKKRKDYQKIMEKLSREALQGLRGEVMVSTTAGDLGAVKKVLEELEVPHKINTDLSAIGGLEVITEDGSVTITNTLNSRLEKAAKFIKPEIAKALFGG